MPHPKKAVFLSYASEDAEAVARLCEALRAAGIEVWFDKNELRGGDSWDQKIRRQIKECALFVPVISATTNARPEGYFRLEWKLAVDRSHLLAQDHPFLFPVVIDDSPNASARVPDKFHEVQWTRLDLRETPESISRRIAVLLAGDVRNPASPGAPALRRRTPRLAVGAVVAIAGVLGLAAYLSPKAWFRPAPPTLPVPANVPRDPVAPAESAARQLVQRARALYEPWDGATREDFALADGLLQQALKLDPTDGEVWAASGMLACGYVILGRDTSPERKEAARSATERAIKLAPESFQARFSNAAYLRFQAATLPEAEKALRALSQENPRDGFVLRTLSAFLRSQNRLDEALATIDRAIALPGGDPLAYYNKHLVLTRGNANQRNEAEAVLDQGLAVRPMPYLYRAKVSILLREHGDLDGAAAMLAKISPAYLLEDSGAHLAWQVWIWRKEPEKAVAAMRAFPRDVFESTEFTGPKAYLTGEAFRVGGLPAAARQEWQAGLQLVEQRLKAQPNSTLWMYWKSLLAACLGQTEVAEETLKTLRQMAGSNSTQVNDQVVPILLRLGHREGIAEAIEKQHATLVATGDARRIALYENTFRYTPEFDSILNDPPIQRILNRPPAKIP